MFTNDFLDRKSEGEEKDCGDNKKYDNEDQDYEQESQGVDGMKEAASDAKERDKEDGLKTEQVSR